MYVYVVLNQRLFYYVDLFIRLYSVPKLWAIF